MRVSDAQRHRDMSRAVARSLWNIDRLQRQIATGRRFARPSEDPGATIRAQELDAVRARNASYSDNLADGMHWMAATEHRLDAVIELLTQMKETALRAGDDAAEDRDTLGDFVDQLLQEVVAQANGMDGDRYVFAGFATQTRPYAASTAVEAVFTAAAPGTAVDLEHARLIGGSVQVTDLAGGQVLAEGTDYRVDTATGRIEALPGGALVAGSAYRIRYTTTTTSGVGATVSLDGEIRRQIGDTRTERVNLAGREVFGAGGEVFQVAIDLKNALWKGDSVAARALIARIDDALAQVTGQLGALGARTAAFETQRTILDRDAVALDTRLSELRDVDVPEAVMRLAIQQNAYQAALGAAARMFEMSLVNFLQ